MKSGPEKVGRPSAVVTKLSALWGTADTWQKTSESITVITSYSSISMEREDIFMFSVPGID
jgi:hypothetical protein